LYYRLIPNAPIPFLIVLALAAWFILRRDPAFDRSHLTNTAAVGPNLAPLLLRSAALCAVLGPAVWRPGATPLVYVREAGAGLLGTGDGALPSALGLSTGIDLPRLLFRPLPATVWSRLGYDRGQRPGLGFVHIALGNWISVVLSTIGGFLFALTYQQSESLILACIEHAIFGNFIFTIGLGQFFYHGTRLKAG
jgi:hypothetical protein